MYKDSHVSFTWFFSYKSCKTLVQYYTKYIGLDIVKLVLKHTKYSIIWKHNIIFSFKCFYLFSPVSLTTAFRFTVSNISRNHCLVFVLRGKLLSSASNQFLSAARSLTFPTCGRVVLVLIYENMYLEYMWDFIKYYFFLRKTKSTSCYKF